MRPHHTDSMDSAMANDVSGDNGLTNRVAGNTDTMSLLPPAHDLYLALRKIPTCLSDGYYVSSEVMA